MRLVEFVLLFVGLIGAYAALGSPGSPIPPLLLLALGAWLVLRRSPDFDRGNLWRSAALRPALPAILVGWAATVIVAVVGVAVLWPDRLFDLPRQSPLVWLAVAVFYPLVSVYPQELVFRAFLLHRYAPVFGTGRRAAAASAAAFGFAHVIFGSWFSVALTLVAGYVFARRYQRTQSLLVVACEHALYGVLAFTVGLGGFFYHAGELPT